MTRPIMYFPSMTAEEVLSYASQYAETELEKMLAQWLADALKEGDELASEEMLSWELNDAGEGLAAAIRDILSEEDDAVTDAVEKYESRVNAAYAKHQRG